MGKFHIRIVAGWCGNQMVIVRDHLFDLISERGYDVKIDLQSIWENNAPPQHADLVLQLIPAFSPEELSKPSLNIRPFLKDLNHQDTVSAVFSALEIHYPRQSDPILFPINRNRI